jgi:hypothetical protein
VRARLLILQAQEKMGQTGYGVVYSDGKSDPPPFSPQVWTLGPGRASERDRRVGSPRTCQQGRKWGSGQSEYVGLLEKKKGRQHSATLACCSSFRNMMSSCACEPNMDEKIWPTIAAKV